MNVMIGYPTETDADLDESIRFVEANRRNLHEIRITAPTLLVQPGTPLANVPHRFGLQDTDHEKWLGADGRNDYAARVGRFKRFCARMIELGDVRVAINRRIIKTPESLDQLVRECLEGVPEKRSESGIRQLRRKVDSLGHWAHAYDLGGLRTRPDDLPGPLWARLAPVFPKELTGKSVLDAGCGDGWFALKAKSLGARSVLAIETNVDCIARAEFARETLGVGGVAFRYGNLCGLKGEGHYDVGLLIDVFQDLDDPVEGLRRVAVESSEIYLTTYLDLRREEPALSWALDHPDHEFLSRVCRPIWLPTQGFIKKAFGPLGFAAVEELDRLAVTKDLAHVILRASMAQPVQRADCRWGDVVRDTADSALREGAAR
jgi:SAM-dependent methyltransferase